MATYQIVRSYKDEAQGNEVIKTGLTLEEARAHCKDPESSSQTAKSAVAVEATKRLGAWADIYREEPGSAENTEFLRQWILGDNHADFYNKAVRVADAGDLDELRELVVKQLREAREDTGAYYTSQEMSDDDFDLVDWAEIRDALVN